MHRLAICLLVVGGLAPVGAEPFELRDGDRVVWIGNTLIEREQRQGYWEQRLTLRYPDRHVTHRNLGWSGDTVWAESRGVFDAPERGFQRLIEGVKGLKPTVLFIAYGTNESFEGPAGVEKFRTGLNRLLDAVAPTKARVVLFTPLPLETSAVRPDVSEANRNLELYSTEIRKVAEKRGGHVVDLFALVQASKWKGLTENSIHLSDDGYRRTAELVEQGLGWKPLGDPSVAQEKLRLTIVEKNRLYFHRWRPQNVTYLFGFRKHEQGKNAAEVPLFEPLVEEQEKEITRLLVNPSDKGTPKP